MKHVLIRIALTAMVGTVIVGISAQDRQDIEELAQRRYQMGLGFLESKNYPQALVELEAIAGGTTTVAGAAKLQLATYYFDVEKDFAKAEQRVASILSSEPSGRSAPMAWILSGRIKLARSRDAKSIDAAVADFQRVRKLFENNPLGAVAKYYEAEARRDAQQYEMSVELFREVSSAYPKSVPWAAKALLGEAHCLVAQGGSTERAMELLQRVRTRFPNSPEAKTAVEWNTILYRLYLRAKPPYVYAGRTLAGPSGKLKDVEFMGVGPDGVLHAAGQNGGQSFDVVSGKVRAPFVVTGLRSIAFDQGGRLVTAQRGSITVAGGRPILLAVTKGVESQPLNDVLAAVITSRGEILVADGSLRSIFRFASQGKVIDTFAAIEARRLAIDGEDHVACLNAANGEVSILLPSGAFAARVSSGQALRKVVDIAFDPLGHLYVLDRDAGSVFVYAPSNRSTPLASFGPPQKTPGAFSRAAALALDGAGRIFIYDERNEAVLIFQ